MNAFLLKDKTALICGGSRGIGKAAGCEMARQGATVILLARDPQVLESALRTLPREHGQEHIAVSADASDLDGLRQAVIKAAPGPVHILLNNSGGPAPGTLADADWEELPAAFTQHVGAAQVLVQILLPGMKEAGYGRIINIISTSVKQPIAGLGVSNTIRGAMASWSKTLASELGPHGITVNNILPGATRTDRLHSLFETQARKRGVSADEVAAEWLSAIPAGRFGEPEELGLAAAFLASPAAAYINGINLPVDGGRTSCL